MKQYFSFQWHITDDCAQRRRTAGRDFRRLSGQGDQRAPWQDQAGQFPSPHGDSGQLCFPGTAQHRGRPEADERFLRRADRHYVLCAEAVFIFGGRLRGCGGEHDAGSGRFGDRFLLYRAGLACVCRPLRAGSVEKWRIPTDHYAVMQLVLGYPREGDRHPTPKPRKEDLVLYIRER